MDPTLFIAVMFLVLFTLLGAGVWVGFGLVAVAAFAMEFYGAPATGASLATTFWSSQASWLLTALPMFVWMGDILYRTRLSEDLFRGLAPIMGRLPGGLLHTNVMGCTIFGSVSGSSAATLSTVGQMTVPELMKRNYPEPLVIGTLAGPATLGLMIPPSIMMVVYGVMTNESIAKINIAGIVPGFVLAAMFTVYVAIKASTMKGYAPDVEPVTSGREKLAAVKLLIPVHVLLFIVLGSMFAGIATATEAAATGVAGSLGLAWWQGTLNWKNFSESLMSSTRTTTMIGFILLASAGLSQAMAFSQLPEHLAQYVATLHLSPFALLMALLVLFTILGCFLDGISCIALTISVVEPLVRQAGIDMIWFGIFVVLVVEMAQITPPVGFNLFVLQSMTGHNIFRIAKWSIPSFMIMLAMVFILIALPGLATWLPDQMFAPAHDQHVAALADETLRGTLTQ
jgi:C4-dicarboxylate transporter, DctM subunit